MTPSQGSTIAPPATVDPTQPPGESLETPAPVAVGLRRNAAAGYVTALAGLVVAFVSTPVLARGLGPASYGVWSVGLAAVSYLEVLELGFGAATVAVVADRSAHRDSEGLRRAVATSFWLLCVPGALAMAAGAGLAVLAPHLFGVPASQVGAARLLIVLLTVDLATSIPCDTFGGVLAGVGRLHEVSLSLAVVLLAQGAAWIVVSALGGGLVPLGAATVSISLAGQLSRYLLARRAVGPLPLRGHPADRSLVRSMSRSSGWFAVTDVNKIVVQRIDLFLVAALAGVVPAGLYAAGQKLAVLATRVADPLAAALFPHAARLRANQPEETANALSRSLRVTAAVSLPLSVSVAWLGGPLIRVWVGGRFAGAGAVVVLLSLAAGLLALSNVSQQIMKGLGAVRRSGVISLVESVINLGGSIVLGLTHGADGVAAATLVAGGVSLALSAPLGVRATGARPGPLMRRLVAPHLLAAGCASVVAVWLRSVDLGTDVAALGAFAAVLATYAGVLVATGLSAGERRAGIAAVRARLSSGGRVG